MVQPAVESGDPALLTKGGLILRRSFGFTLVELMITVAIIGLLAPIGMFSYTKARATAQLNGCLNNLKQIERAKFMWSLEKG